MQPSAIALALLLISLTLISGACQLRSWEPTEPREPTREEPVLPLVPGQRLQQELNCPAGNCQTRLRVQIDGPGRLEVIATPAGDQSHTMMNLILEDSIGRVLDQQAMQQNQSSVRVNSPVQAGPHMVLVRALGGYVPYSIEARFRAGGAVTQPWAEPDRSARPKPSLPKQPAEKTEEEPSAIYDPTINFHNLRKYAFAEEPRKQLQVEPGAAVAGNPFQSHEVQRVLRGELTRRGFTQVPASEADFLISSHVGQQATTWYSVGGSDYRDHYDAYDQQWQNGARLKRHTYSDHTLSLDFIDPRNGKLIWHGWTTEPETSDANRADAIRAAVTKLLNEYPPR